MFMQREEAALPGANLGVNRRLMRMETISSGMYGQLGTVKTEDQPVV
jgi:hypothetical protein